MTTKELVSEILRGVVALAVMAGYIFLVITGGTVPDALLTILGAVVGFYFGVGSAIAGIRLLRLK